MCSMVEGWLPCDPEVRARSLDACAFYPSTSFQLVPLPTGFARREDWEEIHPHVATGGRLIRIASTLPPVLRPNSVPRS